MPAEGTTKIHVRFRGGQTTTLTTVNPKASCEKVKTPSEIVELVDRLLDDHVYDEIADILNARGLRPGGAAWPGRGGARFTGKRVQYIVHTYGLRSRFDRLRARGLLTKKEIAGRLGIHEATLTSWVEARHHQGARVQRPRVALRGAGDTPDEALQPLGSAQRPGGGDPHVTQPEPRSSSRIEGGVV